MWTGFSGTTRRYFRCWAWNVPGAVAIGKWLRRMGAVENIQEALVIVMRMTSATRYAPR
jgi:hypothetical protein